jgi:hypothetical protein
MRCYRAFDRLLRIIPENIRKLIAIFKTKFAIAAACKRLSNSSGELTQNIGKHFVLTRTYDSESQSKRPLLRRKVAF